MNRKLYDVNHEIIMGARKDCLKQALKFLPFAQAFIILIFLEIWHYFGQHNFSSLTDVILILYITSSILWSGISIRDYFRTVEVSKPMILKHVLLAFLNSLLGSLSITFLYFYANEKELAILAGALFSILMIGILSLYSYTTIVIFFALPYISLTVPFEVTYYKFNTILILVLVWLLYLLILYFSHGHMQTRFEKFIAHSKLKLQSEQLAELYRKEKEYNEKISIYESVLEQATVSIIITGKEGDIEYVNPFFSKLSEYTLEEVMGKTPAFLKSGKTEESVFQELWECITQGETWIGQFVNKKKTGDEYKIASMIYPIKDSQNLITHYVAINENISEKMKMKTEINNQLIFINQLINKIPSIIFYTNEVDVLIGANEAYCQSYGVCISDVINKEIYEFPWMTEEKYNTFVEMKQESIKSKKTSIRYIKRLMEDGSIYNGLFTVSPYYQSDDSIGGFLGVMTDITELKQKETDLEEALKKANEVTNAKSQFLANMSHEIRTPMNAIIGMSYLMLKTSLNIKQQDYVMKIHNAATSLLRIINDILDFSKIESGKMNMESVEFDLDILIMDTINLQVNKAQEKQLELLYNFPYGEPLKLIGDPLRLGQVIANLMSNAIKFTQAGEIEIAVAEEKQEGTRLKLRFSVRDTGIGIKKEEKDTLFQAFTQSDSSTTRMYGGTGLGLAISKEIVEMMGGEIWIESEYGRGSTFQFTAWFDLAHGKDKTEGLMPDIRPEMKRHPLSGVKILLAEDNDMNQEIVCEILSAQGAVVDIAVNGHEALNIILAQSSGIEYNLILMDVQMPIMDGFEAAKSIRKVSKDIPIIAMTARTMIEEREECFKAGMNDHISKPIDPNNLFTTIMKWLPNNGIPDLEQKEILPSAVENDTELVVYGIDTVAALKRVANNKKLYIRLLHNFADNYGNVIDEMIEAVQRNDFDVIKRTSHTLKGVSGNIGATTLQHGFDNINKCLGTISEKEHLVMLLRKLEEEMERIIESIKQIPANQEKEQDIKIMSDVEILACKNKLLLLLEDGNSEAVEYWVSVKLALKTIFDSKTFYSIESIINSYDFEAAIQLIKEKAQK